ncbi:Rrf2 family transcriptional regulator [Snodgrassella sp. CFCC 13594]|uniref:RrF2 family transcriptional regulator n=1 Tax=Snodgrassella sp. CFCC 13594 TaxID=1775559 RepID=UPI0008310F83|nr:Rrf2 family transcriptional regulator [Snodgrassella sp. CFCC 13594]
MQLNRFTDLGLRVLIMLSHTPPTQKITVAQIAQALSVSQNHLVKIVHFMASAGWVESFKGRHGGIRLAPASYARPLGELVQQLEIHSSEGRPLIDCHQPPCSLLPLCSLPPLLAQAQQAFYQALNQHTLQDISRHDSQSNEIVVQWLSTEHSKDHARP